MSDDSSNPPSRSHGWPVALIAMLATVFFFVAAQVTGGIIVSLYPALHHWSASQSNAWLTQSVLAQFFYGLIANGFLLAGIAFVMRRLKWTRQTIGLTMPTLKQLMIGILAAAPYYGLYFVMVAVFSAVFPALNINQKQDIGFESVHGTVPLLLTFASLVVIPPLAEEITMRGFLYSGLKKWLSPVLAGLVVSGLFGAAHLAEGGDAGPLWIGAIDTFSLSLVLVFLREKTGNLWAGIMLHATKNFVAFAVLFLIGGR